MLQRQIVSAPTLEAIEQLAAQRLCEHNAWETSSTTMKKQVLRRGGRICGMMLIAHGPKRQACHAIWSGPEHRVLFYDTAGKRFAEVTLCDAPDYHRMAA